MLTEQDIRIIHLAEVPEESTKLEMWFIDEWTPWYGSDGPGDAKNDLAACLNRDELPICLVALNKDGELLGTASLKEESVGSEPGVGPWLAAVLVEKNHQGKGIGTALVKAVEEQASLLGFEEINTSTDTAMRILERRGWLVSGETGSLRGPLTIYRCKIPSRATNNS